MCTGFLLLFSIAKKNHFLPSDTWTGFLFTCSECYGSQQALPSYSRGGFVPFVPFSTSTLWSIWNKSNLPSIPKGSEGKPQGEAENWRCNNWYSPLLNGKIKSLTCFLCISWLDFYFIWTAQCWVCQSLYSITSARKCTAGSKDSRIKPLQGSKGKQMGTK